MSIALFSEILANFPAQRCQQLRGRIPGGIDCVYALLWPDYPDPHNNSPARNREAFTAWRTTAGVRTWAWINVQEDQAQTAAAIALIENELDPDGYCLDIEGHWTKGAKLGTTIAAVKRTGKPVRASLAAQTSSHVEYDYRGLDAAGITIDWQAYWVSGEGQTPAVAVNELYRSSFVIDGWEYRHRIDGKGYGWGKFLYGETSGLRGQFDSYKIPGSPNANFALRDREWGWWVGDDRKLYSGGKPIGLLLGRATHPHIRCTIDVTRGAAQKYTLPEWTAWAASSRIVGVGKKPVSVYLAEVAPDPVLIAIGAGSA